MQPVTEMGIDLRRTPHVLGVPRYMYGSAVRDLAGVARAAVTGRSAEAFRREMMLAYFAGYVVARRRDGLGSTRTWSAPAGDSCI